MIEDQLSRIAAWFDSFVATFQAPSPAEQRNYDLKIEHTTLVRRVMERLTCSLSLSADERALAAIIAVCHDVGRFPQYKQYGTFNDATSVNHASLSLQTLQEEGILAALAEEPRRLILQAIALHNVFSLPDNLDPSPGRFAMLIRDADKLDIWRVLIEYCTAAPQERASAVVWELPDTGFCSDAAIKEVVAGRMTNDSLKFKSYAQDNCSSLKSSAVASRFRFIILPATTSFMAASEQKPVSGSSQTTAEARSCGAAVQ